HLALVTHFGGACQLMNANGGGNIGQVVLVAGSDDPVIPAAARGIAPPGVVRKSMKRHAADALGQFGVGGHGHAALAGRDRLVGVERKAADSCSSFPTALPGTAWPWPPCCGEGVSRVLHHPEPVMAGEILNGGDVHH